MYEFVYNDGVLDELNKASKQSPSIKNKLERLQTNPIANAIKTNVPHIGEYYVNAGIWCILFDIDTVSQEVQLLSVVHSAKLHKIRTGRINP